MSRSQGAGSPVWFLCPKERIERNRNRRRFMFGMRDHGISRTGRNRPYKPPFGSALGLRSMNTSWEYICDCGYRGWTNHKDILRKPLIGTDLVPLPEAANATETKSV